MLDESNPAELWKEASSLLPNGMVKPSTLPSFFEAILMKNAWLNPQGSREFRGEKV
jgi:hypothetical protein|tara:strand:- start:1819 stop:1986 length:168 start_codon:yes stop_codon:yes gene_type:complete